MTVLHFSARTWAAGLLALAAAAAAPLARADNVYWSIGAVTPGVSVGVSNARPVYVQPAPVYVQPSPVYVQPAPAYAPPPMYVYPRPDFFPGQVIYTPPRVVYPQPVYVQPPPAWGPPGHWRHPHGHGHGHGGGNGAHWR